MMPSLRLQPSDAFAHPPHPLQHQCYWPPPLVKRSWPAWRMQSSARQLRDAQLGQDIPLGLQTVRVAEREISVVVAGCDAVMQM